MKSVILRHRSALFPSWTSEISLFAMLTLSAININKWLAGTGSETGGYYVNDKFPALELMTQGRID
jgi:hypothetical protein